MNKKTLAIGILLCVLLCGCEKKGALEDPVPDGEEETQQTEETAADDSQTRIAYYEKLVGELQEELLNMKTELYASRVEYESRIAELEAQKAPAGEEGSVPSHSEFQYTLQNGMAVITGYTGTEKILEIPTALDGYTVFAIGDRAFMNNTRLSSVTLPKTVTQIGWFAFSGCIALEEIYIPSTVESISYGAFQNCPSALSIACHSGSYAELYAHSYGIKVK